MDKFINRLKYYGVGFGIGLVFVFFFFQNRGCSWLPDNRVKNSILDRVIAIPDEDLAYFKEKGISEDKIVNLLNHGEVDFSKSKRSGNLKIYFVSTEDLKLYFTLPEENFISEVRRVNKVANKIKNSSSGFGKLIHFPNDENLVYVDSSSVLTCKQEFLGFINQKLILKRLKKSGRVDFNKTFFYKTPKPLIYLNYTDSKGNLIGSEAIWYKNKINIRTFDIPFETKCH